MYPCNQSNKRGRTNRKLKRKTRKKKCFEACTTAAAMFNYSLRSVGVVTHKGRIREL